MKGNQVWVYGLLLVVCLLIGFFVGVLKGEAETINKANGYITTSYYSGFESGYKTGLDGCYESYEWVYGDWVDDVEYECVTERDCIECPLVSKCNIKR